MKLMMRYFCAGGFLRLGQRNSAGVRARGAAAGRDLADTLADGDYKIGPKYQNAPS